MLKTLEEKYQACDFMAEIYNLPLGMHYTA